MRKLIVCFCASLDGFFEGPGGNVMALPLDGFFDGHNLERLRAADTLLLGAKTYMLFKGYWPSIDDNPEASGVVDDPGRIDVVRKISRRLNEIDKVVVSDTLTADDTAPWTDTTTIVRRGEAHEAITKLKDGPGSEIFTSGSGTLWNDLATRGLVDELYVMVGALVLGGGTPAYTARPFPALRLLESRGRDDSDNMLLRYGVVRTDEEAMRAPA